MGKRVRAHVHISGQVQGVFFRQETLRRAESLGLGGWVRNLPDGRVEAVFEGDNAAVQAALDWCALGPALADVRSTQIDWEPPQQQEVFRIR